VPEVLELNQGRGGAPLGHTTRTMVFGPDNYLYIGISSLNNVDSDSSRSRVYRFPFSNFNSMSQSFDFQTGQIWADGLRNPLAIMFDSRNRLWELDNGPDNLSRPDILADIYQDNPAEELNLLDGPAWYGYPHCFTVGNLTRSFGTDPQFLQQFAWAPNSVYNDAFCQNAGNNRPPVSGIPAHSSPIQGTFFQECGQLEGSFPCSMKGDLFASLHGSWNRERPVGYNFVTKIFSY
jgi:glucose/arabinose dehydrogenase